MTRPCDEFIDLRMLIRVIRLRMTTAAATAGPGEYPDNMVRHNLLRARGDDAFVLVQ